MIEYRTGDILMTNAEALVNTVNCVGIMGRGIALQFKNAYPANFKAYAAACKRGEVQPGRMFVFETGTLGNPQLHHQFPDEAALARQEPNGGYRRRPRRALAQEIRVRDIRSIAVPPLGSGLGGLNWPDVRERIEAALRGFNDVEIVVYEPNGAPDPKVMARTQTAPEMTPGRAALVGLMYRYLGGLMDPFVTLLEVHKLLYFIQEAGQPLLAAIRSGVCTGRMPRT